MQTCAEHSNRQLNLCPSCCAVTVVTTTPPPSNYAECIYPPIKSFVLWYLTLSFVKKNTAVGFNCSSYTTTICWKKLVLTEL